MNDKPRIIEPTPVEVTELRRVFEDVTTPPEHDYRFNGRGPSAAQSEYIDNVLSELGLEGNVAARHSIAQAMLDAAHDTSIMAEAEDVSREMLADDYEAPVVSMPRMGRRPNPCAEVFSPSDLVDPELDPTVGNSSSNRPVPEGMIPDEVDTPSDRTISYLNVMGIGESQLDDLMKNIKDIFAGPHKAQEQDKATRQSVHDAVDRLRDLDVEHIWTDEAQKSLLKGTAFEAPDDGFGDMCIAILEGLMNPRPFDPSALHNDRKVGTRPVTPKFYSVSELLDEIFTPPSSRPKDSQMVTPRMPPSRDVSENGRTSLASPGVTVEEPPVYNIKGDPTAGSTTGPTPTAWMMTVREWPLGPVINRSVRLVSDLTSRDKERIGDRKKVIEYRDNRNYYITLTPLFL